MRHQPSTKLRDPTSGGFTLIEISIVLTILGIVAAVAIPNLLNALDRGRQSSTLTDIRALGTAMERYAADHHRYPVVDGVAKLGARLTPDYIKKVPVRDGWGHPLLLEVDPEGSTYTIISPGKDGELQTEELTELTQDFAADIVYVDGVFVQRPAGRQE